MQYGLFSRLLAVSVLVTQCVSLTLPSTKDLPDHLIKRVNIDSSCDSGYGTLGPVINVAAQWAKAASTAAGQPSDPYFAKYFNQLSPVPSRDEVRQKFITMAQMLTGQTQWTIRCGADSDAEQERCDKVQGLWTGPWGTMVCPGFTFGTPDPKCGNHGAVWVLIHENLLTKPQGVGDVDGRAWSSYAQDVALKC